MATQKITVGIRLPKELKEQAQKAADEDRRSFSLWIELLIEAALKERKAPSGRR